jgi:hypothetical protein
MMLLLLPLLLRKLVVIMLFIVTMVFRRFFLDRAHKTPLRHGDLLRGSSRSLSY